MRPGRVNSVYPKNRHKLCKGKYHCTADLLCDWIGNDQISNSVANSKQLNTNK